MHGTHCGHRDFRSVHCGMVVSNMDSFILQLLYEARHLFLTNVFFGITELGSTIAIGGISLAVGVVLLVKKHFSLFIGLCISVLGTAVAAFSLKDIVERTRPDILYQAYLESGFSFPSGHAALSFALYGFIVYILWKFKLERHILAITLAIILVSLIGFSRLYLGVHYATDVIAGYTLAAAFLFVGIRVSERLSRSILS